MNRRAIALVLGMLLVVATAACASPEASTVEPEAQEGGSGPVLPTPSAAPEATDPGRGTGGSSDASPVLLLVDVTENGQGLRVRPVDPVSLADLPGYSPLDAGHHSTHAVSPDGRTIAAITWPSGSSNQGGVLHVLDLPSWTVRTTGLTFDDHVGELTFGPYGKALYWLGPTQTDPSHGMPRDYRLYRYIPGAVEPPPLTDLTAFPSSFAPWETRFLRSGRLAVYGIPTDPNNLAEDSPHVLLVDVTTGRIDADVRLDGVTAGQMRTETDEGEPWYQMFTPGLAWDLERDRLYVVHAAEDRVTVVDLAEGKVVKQTDIRPRLSVWDRLWRWLVPAAEAKLVPGTERRALLSADGSRLYVVGLRREMIEEAEGAWTWREIPLGLQVIATDDLTELRRLDLPVSGAALSPDGRRLLLTGRSEESVGGRGSKIEGSGLYVLDAEGLEVLAHLEPGTEFRLLDFSPDGRYAYVNHTVSLGDRTTYKEALQVLDLASLRFVAERELAGYGALLPTLGSQRDTR